MSRRTDRIAAWLYTGPLGHLWGGLADWAEFFTRFAWARARAKLIAGGRSATGRARP